MYHEGNIQSGITLALRESKHVVCLVRDDAEGSSTWEEQYLADEEISSLLKEKAVVLRLNAGSKEAGFLSSYCPVGEIPTLVVIKDGKLLEYMTPDVTAGEFKSRVKAALEDVTVATTSQATPARQRSYAPAAPSQPASTLPPRSTPTAPSNPTPAVPSQAIPTRATPATPTPKAGRSEQDPEAQRRESIRAGKKPAKEENDPEDNSRPEQDEWKNQQRKMEQQQKEERQRVRHQIKQDNIERQRRDERRRSTAMMRPASLQPLTPTKLEQVRLQVRLLDGSSIRKTFLPSNTIRQHVRPWVDEQRSDGAVPYTLKQILAPHPNRSFTTVEENQTLEELKLGPTANLILVTLKRYTDAYPNDSTSSLARGIYAGYEFLFNLIAALAEIFTTLVGIREAPSTASGPPPSTDQSTSESRRTDASASGNARTGQPQRTDDSGSGSIRTRPPQRTEAPSSGSVRGTSSTLNIRTLRDQRDERDEFYNGNQLNFQPRPDLDDSE